MVAANTGRDTRVGTRALSFLSTRPCRRRLCSLPPRAVEANQDLSSRRQKIGRCHRDRNRADDLKPSLKRKPPSKYVSGSQTAELVRRKSQLHSIEAASRCLYLDRADRSLYTQARKTASGLRENRQVAALQDKIRALEQREGAKVVALQRRAADATAEVQHLRTENGQLHALVAQLRTQLDAARHTQQHPEMTEGADRDEVCTRSTKRRRTQGAATAVATAFDDLGSPYMSGHAPLSPNSSSAAHSPPHDSDRLYTLQPVASTSALTNDSCGYCSASSGGCFCGSADTNNGYIGSTAASPMDERVKLEPDFAVEAPTQNQLPLPIRQRPKSAFRAQPASLWALNPAQPTSTADKPALCNGDPSNCPACSDDP